MRDLILFVCPTYCISHTSHIIAYTAYFVLQFVPWMRQWNVLPLLVLEMQLAEAMAVLSGPRLPWHTASSTGTKKCENRYAKFAT